MLSKKANLQLQILRAKLENIITNIAEVEVKQRGLQIQKAKLENKREKLESDISKFGKSKTSTPESLTKTSGNESQFADQAEQILKDAQKL